MLTDRIAVIIPSIPPRWNLLSRAVCTVADQTMRAHEIHIAVDTLRDGAPKTRQRALDAVDPKRTHWVATLDDDDEMLPFHLDHLLRFANDGGYDLVYSWFKVVIGKRILDYDPVFPVTHFTDPWDPANPRHTTVTVLVRAELAKEIGYDTPDERGDMARQQNTNEDWRFTLEANRLGKIGHLVEHTWLWHHDSNNTSGLPSRW